MAISANVGFIIGPALAGLLGSTRYGDTIPMIAAFLISLSALLVIVFWLQETRVCTSRNIINSRAIPHVFG